MTAYRIEFAPAAERQFRKLPRNIQLQLQTKISGLSQNPRPPGAVKLEGEPDLYRIRSGEYRVVYQIRDDVLLVLVVRIGHRRDVYKKRGRSENF